MALAKASEDIIAAILVGSGAVGFLDEYSDLDFYMVVNREENIEKAMHYISGGINEQLQLLRFAQLEDRKLQVHLTSNFLEIDIGYVSFDQISALRKQWKVLFDKTGTVDAAMCRSWEQRYKEPQAGETVADYAGKAWHFLFHAAVAIRRGQVWRSVAEVDIARNMLIELMGLRHSLETKRYRAVDRLPAEDLSLLEKTLATCLSRKALSECLNCLVEATYDELEAYPGIQIPVGRQQVREYIQAVLGA